MLKLLVYYLDFAKVFLKTMYGNANVANKPNSQTISVANTHVCKPLILIPLETKFVINNPTNVVTNATPPLKAGIFFIAIFVIKGSAITATIVNIATAITNDKPVILNPSKINEATNKPIAFASKLTVSEASNLTI